MYTTPIRSRPGPAAILSLALMALAGAGCGQHDAASARAESAAPRPAAAPAEAESSDLDRPLGDLLAARCEHGMPTFQCDDCRYEVGMVKVAPDLFDADGPFATARAARRPARDAVAHNGEVRLNEERAAWLSPRTPGTVRSILVDLGARVRRGDVLFTVDSPEFAAARSAYRVAAASLKLAADTLERQRDLYAKQVIARKDLLEAEAARDGAVAVLDAAREALLACGLSPAGIDGLTSSESASNAMPVRAPFDGTVLERNLGFGARVEPGQDLLLLGDTSEMWVWTTLDETELPAALAADGRGTMRAFVEVPAYPGRIFEGFLDRVSGRIDEATRTAKVRVVVPNPENLLRAGMFARVGFAAERAGEALAVPAEAVLEDEGRDFVFIPVEPPYFVRRPVVTGRSWGPWIEIARGLDEGDVVMSRGAFALKSDVLRSKMGAGCAD